MRVSQVTTPLTVFFLMSLMLIGCGPTRKPDGIRNDPLAYDKYPQIVVLDHSRQSVAIQAPPFAGINDKGVYEVIVPLRSLDSKSKAFRYRFIYFDEHGIELDRDVWSSQKVPGKTAFQVRGKSLYSGIDQWRLEIGDQHHMIRD